LIQPRRWVIPNLDGFLSLFRASDCRPNLSHFVRYVCPLVIGEITATELVRSFVNNRAHFFESDARSIAGKSRWEPVPERYGTVGVGTLQDYTTGDRRVFDASEPWNANDIVGFDVGPNGSAINLQAAIGVPAQRPNARGNYGCVALVSGYKLQSELSPQKLHEIQSIWAQNVPGGKL
jgi:hypothetical protein